METQYQQETAVRGECSERNEDRFSVLHVLIQDVRPEDEFSVSHVAGAVRVEPNTQPDLQALGVTEDTTGEGDLTSARGM